MTATATNALSSKISVRNIYKVFGSHTDAALSLLTQDKSKAEVLQQTGCNVGLRNISLEIPEGKISVIMGLSGSGKSTLVRHFNRLIEPTQGEILIDGKNILALDADGLRQLRRDKISMVFQSFGLLPHWSVLDNASTKRLSSLPTIWMKRFISGHKLPSYAMACWCKSVAPTTS
jgi:glycine betaine/proline transport system ATP-binding protein